MEATCVIGSCVLSATLAFSGDEMLMRTGVEVSGEGDLQVEVLWGHEIRSLCWTEAVKDVCRQQEQMGQAAAQTGFICISWVKKYETILGVTDVWMCG